jgi:hypothetical protein
MGEKLKKIALKTRRKIFEEEKHLSLEIKKIRDDAEAELRAQEEKIEESLLGNLGNLKMQKYVLFNNDLRI